MPALPTLTLVRHGETEWSRTHRHTGRTDLPLEPTGEQEARATAKPLAGLQPALVLSSPLARARETANLAGFGSNADFHLEIDPDLMEWDYGDYEGRTTASIQAERPGWLLFRDGCPNGEVQLRSALEPTASSPVCGRPMRMCSCSHTVTFAAYLQRAGLA